MQQQPYGAFLYQSEPGDYVGQGHNGEYATNDTSFAVRTSTRNSVSFDIRRGDEWWSVEFAAPKGQNLKPDKYNQAERYAFQADNKPGFDMHGNGRGSNRLFAGFIVRNIRFNNAGGLVLFHAQFAQRSEQIDAPTLTGEIYYRNYKPAKKKGSVHRTFTPILVPQNTESRGQIEAALLNVA